MLKNWKRQNINMNPNWWVNKLNHTDIGVWKQNNGKYAVQGTHGSYYKHNFKTKAEAIKHARAYVRKH